MADIIKKTINRILSLFPIPKMHPKLYDMEKETEQIALLGEINTEKGGANAETEDTVE